eukprot:Sspe_Gene.96351::Locus_69003_Transcript_1_1_Confidence_1.000_Length_837::g.96351::m.96351
MFDEFIRNKEAHHLVAAGEKAACVLHVFLKATFRQCSLHACQGTSSAADKCIMGLPASESAKMKLVRGKIETRCIKDHGICAATLLTPASMATVPAPGKDAHTVFKYDPPKEVKQKAKAYLWTIDVQLPVDLIEYLGHSGSFSHDDLEEYNWYWCRQKVLRNGGGWR